MNFEYQQIAEQNDDGLYLAEHEEQQIPPEIQLVRLRVDEPVAPRLNLEYRAEHNAAHPYRQHRVERSHCRAVVFNGVDGGDGRLHDLREIFAVYRRTAAEYLNDGLDILLPVESFQLVQGVEKRVLRALSGRLEDIDHIRAGFFDLCRRLLEHRSVVRQYSRAVHHIRNLDERRGDLVADVLHAGNERFVQLDERRERGGGVFYRTGENLLIGKLDEPFTRLTCGICHSLCLFSLGFDVIQRFSRLCESRRIAENVLSRVCDRALAAVAVFQHFQCVLKRGVYLVYVHAYLRDGRVDIRRSGHGILKLHERLIQLLRVEGVRADARSRGGEVSHRFVGSFQRVYRLLYNAVERAGRVIVLYVLGYFVCRFHHRVDDDLKIRLVY